MPSSPVGPTSWKRLAATCTSGRRRGLDLGLAGVVALEQLLAPIAAEQPRELPADAGVPVDERAVAVERRPTLCHTGSLSRRGIGEQLRAVRAQPLSLTPERRPRV